MRLRMYGALTKNSRRMGQMLGRLRRPEGVSPGGWAGHRAGGPGGGRGANSVPFLEDERRAAGAKKGGGLSLRDGIEEHYAGGSGGGGGGEGGGSKRTSEATSPNRRGDAAGGRGPDTGRLAGGRLARGRHALGKGHDLSLVGTEVVLPLLASPMPLDSSRSRGMDSSRARGGGVGALASRAGPTSSPRDRLNTGDIRLMEDLERLCKHVQKAEAEDDLSARETVRGKA